MSSSVPRRSLLSGGAGLAATAVIAARSLRSGNSSEAAGDVVVRWDAKSRKWAQRPAGANFGVVFLSTNDPQATAPTHSGVQAGDVWRRHPDADEA